MLDLSARKVYGALAEQCVGGDAKADKVENATSGHLAGLDSNGNLTDSGVSPTEEVTVEGNPVTFDSPFEQDAKSVVVSVKPIQAGSGTPSPENIRPISGIDEVEIEVSDGESEPTTTTIPLPSTLYDADVDVTNGDADSRYGYIASYNGETLPGAWISDRDVYTGSNSPTIGAEVCYELATPTTISFDPTDVELVEGTNVVTTNCEKVAVTYGRSLWQDIDKLKTDIEGLGTKAEISAIADSEPDATASQPYAVGGHFYKDGKFCTAIAQIASGATFTKGTNYVEGTIADNLIKQATFSGTTSSDGNLKLGNSVINILSAIVTDVAWCVAIPYVSNGNTFIHVIADDGSNTVKSSTAISGTYFYI